MAESGPSEKPGQRQSRAPRTGGIGAHTAAAAGSLLDYFDARVRLAGLEAREARGAILRRVVAAAAGAFFLLIAYLGLLTGGIGLIADHFEKPWHLVTLAVAGAHLLLAVLGFLYARLQFREPPFGDTRKEFKKDRKWLNSMRPPKS